MYKKVKVDSCMDETSRMPVTLNFTFMGNPGTGKTSVARTFGRLLHAVGARQSAQFAELKAQHILSAGEEAFGELLHMMLKPPPDPQKVLEQQRQKQEEQQRKDQQLMDGLLSRFIALNRSPRRARSSPHCRSCPSLVAQPARSDERNAARTGEGAAGARCPIVEQAGGAAG